MLLLLMKNGQNIDSFLTQKQVQQDTRLLLARMNNLCHSSGYILPMPPSNKNNLIITIILKRNKHLVFVVTCQFQCHISDLCPLYNHCHI